MSPQQLKDIAKIAILGGVIRVTGDLLYSAFAVKGVFYICNAISHVMFWWVFTCLFKKLEWKLGRIAIDVFFIYGISALLDEIFFDPSKLQLNEVLFAIIVLIWSMRNYIKCLKNK